MLPLGCSDSIKSNLTEARGSDMYNVHKMLTLDSNPLIRLEKRLNALKHTHNAGLARSTFLTENNFNVNRQLMESLILRLRSIDPKSKKSKRVANRVKVGSPKVGYRFLPMFLRECVL